MAPDKQPKGQMAPRQTAPEDKKPQRTNDFFEIFRIQIPECFDTIFVRKTQNCFLVSLNEPTYWYDDLENPLLPSPFFPYPLSMTKYTFYCQRMNNTGWD